MLDFFNSILSFIELVWVWFLNLLNTLTMFIETLASAVSLPFWLSGYAWAPIATCIVAITGFAVVKMIIGRSNV